MTVGTLKAGLWKLITLPIVGIIYYALISEGLRLLLPALGVRLYKLPIPGISMLERYSGVYRLDLAHVLSILLMFASWYLWVVLLTILCTEKTFFSNSKWEPDTYRRIVTGLGIVILGSDALLFYTAMLNQGGVWGTQSVFSLPALLATIAYVGVLIFVAFVSVNLQNSDKE